MLIKWGIIAALIAAFAGFFWVKGDEHGTEKLTNYVGKQAVETVRISEARVQIVRSTEIEYRDRFLKVFQKGDTIVKEVKVYVTQKDDAGCAIPVGFVREYNAAWTGTPAGSPAESDRGPSGVPLSTVAEIDAGNAKTCLIYKLQRDGLIDFYRAQQAVK